MDSTQPLLLLDFAVTEQRTHDYKTPRHHQLFAALDVGSGLVTAASYPERTR